PATVPLHSAYYLALAHEAVREYARAGEIYRTVARTNPEELARLVPRLEGLLAKDYQNSSLRLQVADLMLQTGRLNEATQQFTLALETDPRCAAPLAERIAAFLGGGQENPGLRLLLVSARQAAGDSAGSLAAMRPLVGGSTLLMLYVEMYPP